MQCYWQQANKMEQLGNKTFPVQKSVTSPPFFCSLQNMKRHINKVNYHTQVKDKWCHRNQTVQIRPFVSSKSVYSHFHRQKTRSVSVFEDADSWSHHLALSQSRLLLKSKWIGTGGYRWQRGRLLAPSPSSSLLPLCSWSSPSSSLSPPWSWSSSSCS